jgi:protein SCO1/2
MKFLIVSLLVLSTGCQTTTSNKLPILSYKIDDTGKKEFYAIHYSGFVNQLNVPFSNENIKGKVFIANFFFTRCPSICPPMRTKLIDIGENFKNDPNFMIVSHTIDPENDSVAVLMNYSDSTGIPSEKWQFLRASIEKTKLQANLYMTNFKPNDEGTDFFHSSYVALVDKNQRIRGFYNVLLENDCDRLKNDIELLLY